VNETKLTFSQIIYISFYITT